MARRYRCTNCGTDFVSDKRACAACEIDAATDPSVAFIVHPIVTIHYDPPHAKIKHRGLGHRACDPSKNINTGRGTGVPSVVNCEACKATAAFQAAIAAGALHADMLDGEDEIIAPPATAGVQASKETDCGCGKG